MMTECLGEVDYWHEAICGELHKAEAEKFSVLVRMATSSAMSAACINAQVVIWQFEGKPYGLKYLRAVQKDKELMSLCEEVVSLYRREATGEVVPANLLQDLHTKIAKAWDVAGWRERERRVIFARKWAWLGARKWAWLGIRPWSNTWAWAIAATRQRNYAQAVSLTRLWAEVRIIAKIEIGKKARMQALQKYFIHSIHTP